MAPRNEIPSFCKGILFPESTKRLILPKAFGPYLKGRLLGNVFLRNPYKDLWPVEIARSETGEYTFKEGWPRFAEKNKLEFQDFLIFQYDGNSIFDVKIYGKNMDEKEYARFPEVKPEPDEVEQPCQLQKKRQLPQQPRPEVEQPRQPQKKLQLPQQPRPEVEQPRQPQKKRQLPQQPWLEVEQPRQPQKKWQLPQQPWPEVEQPRQPQKKWQLPQQPWPEVEQRKEMEIERELEEEVIRELEPNEEMSRNKKRKRAIRDAYEDVVFESGIFPRPDNPYFVTRRREKLNSLYIPVGVMKDHNLKNSSSLDLCDELNRRWSAKVHVWEDGRIWLGGGWKAMCRRNNIRTTDLCLCEFIPATPEHKMFLKIRVAREAAVKAV